MLAFDTSNGSFVFTTGTGAPIASAVLLLEDAEGTHEFSGGPADKHCAGQAGPWHVAAELPPTQDLDALRLRIAPAAGRVLKRVFLQFASGTARFPALDTPATRMLVPPFVGGRNQEGIVTLGDGRSAATRLMTLLSDSGTGRAFLFGNGRPDGDFSFFEATPALFKAGLGTATGAAPRQRSSSCWRVTGRIRSGCWTSTRPRYSRLRGRPRPRPPVGTAGTTTAVPSPWRTCAASWRRGGTAPSATASSTPS